MATIKPIEVRAVHQIQSGQVIVDLCSVVKELVENSLDSGATSIEVKFKNQGLDSIEVQDNGDGISPSNYETMALKHHTSKLSSYTDLLNLKTFGFRGEALSSLCAVAHVNVVTCLAEDVPKGNKLEFETSGKLKEIFLVAAQKGTTVIVQNLFRNLPVRRREFERNIKREWSKVTNLLGQYACIQKGIKFSVFQQGEKGKRATVFSTKGNFSTKENIVNVFGAKMLSTLIPLDLILEIEAKSSCNQRRTSQDGNTPKCMRVLGHISRLVSGEGRQTPDRQMFFVNNRPCALPQISKTFNEVFKSFNGTLPPFIFANIELDTHLYDVNVSPDKRTILLHNQNEILEALRVALSKFLESQHNSIPVSQFSLQKKSTYRQSALFSDSNICTAEIPCKLTVTSSNEHECGLLDSDEDIDENFPSNSKQRSPVSSLSMAEPGPSFRNQINNFCKSINTNFDRFDKDEEPYMLLNQKEYNRDEQLRNSNTSSNFLTNTMRLVQTPKSKRPNSSYLSDEKYSKSPETKKICRTYKTNAYSDKLSSSLNYPQESLYSNSSRYLSTPVERKGSAEIATITIGEHTTISKVGTPCPTRVDPGALSNHENLDSRTPKKLSNSVLDFGRNLSQMFSVTAPTQSRAISDGNEISNVGSGEGEYSLELSQKSFSMSEEYTDTDCEILEALNVTQSSIASLTEEESKNFAITHGIENEEYIDDDKKKEIEEAKVQELIWEAENSAAKVRKEEINPCKSLMKRIKKNESTFNLIQTINTNISNIKNQLAYLQYELSSFEGRSLVEANDEQEPLAAEEKLSLKISKTDFLKMKIIGQFNLGFILVSRSCSQNDDKNSIKDDIFIIDQHASDEKYNFERLQATTIVQSQKLVVPKLLNLTALEEEIVIENLSNLQSNGFVVSVDQSGERPVGNRCELISLPLSRETTFSFSDLEELLSLLADHPPGTIPRPSKVQKMFAMRACRSSIMIGKTLSRQQMEKIVAHLGELDKPWNCPHGRPTMRHLCSLDFWDTVNLREIMGTGTVWKKYLERNRMSSA